MMLSLVLAASLVIFSGGSDAPPPYTVDQSGITLPAGDTFRDNGHVNIRADKPHHDLHFEGKCVTRTDAECAGLRHEAAQYIGKSFIPWSAFGLTGEFCVPWVQISHYNEHFGEGKDDHGNPVKPVCIVIPPTEEPTPEPTPDPTDEPSEPPTDEPTEKPTPDPTDEPSEEPTPDPTTDTPTEEPTPNPTTDTPVTPEPTKEPTPWTPTPSPSSSHPSSPAEPSSTPSQLTPSSGPSVPVSESSSTPSTSTSDSSRSAGNTSVVEPSGPPAKTEQENLASTGSSSVAGPVLLGLVFAFGGAYLLRRSRLGKS